MTLLNTVTFRHVRAGVVHNTVKIYDDAGILTAINDAGETIAYYSVAKLEAFEQALFYFFAYGPRSALSWFPCFYVASETK